MNFPANTPRLRGIFVPLQSFCRSTQAMKNEASQTLRLAFPIIIGELAQMALHLIDSAMVGAISYKQLAAAALVINAMNIPFVIGIGMTISVSQMVSLANGRRDAQQVSHYLFNGFCLCTLTALAFP